MTLDEIGAWCDAQPDIVTMCLMQVVVGHVPGRIVRGWQLFITEHVDGGDAPFWHANGLTAAEVIAATGEWIEKQTAAVAPVRQKGYRPDVGAKPRKRRVH